MKFGDMKIGLRMTIGFVVMLVLMTVIALTGYNRLATMNTEIKSMVNGPIKKNGFADEWMRTVNINVAYTIALLRSEPGADRDFFTEETTKQAPIIEGLIKQANQNISADPEEHKLYEAILAKRAQYIDVRNQLLASQAKAQTEESKSAIDSEFMPAVKAYLGTLDEIKAYYARTMNHAVTSANNTFTYGYVVLFSILVIGLILGVINAFVLTRSITQPLKTAVAVADHIANGDLIYEDDTAIKKDETGLLLLSLRRMRENLLHTVATIRSSADSISASSIQIAAGNMDLSSRTEEQASSLEETAASMEELTSTVKQNAENAAQAHMMSLQASSSASKGKTVIHDVVMTKQDITASSHKMEDIINVIDGIAFQTNILALNAAVEAARAGEQGRGFAVVATEVRSLAQRSATAAKEIKTLIDTSVAQILHGSTLAANAGEVMNEIALGAHKSTDVIAEISAASKEQSAGIDQVSQAVMQLDQVTQQNAALVEQSASASESMKSQAVKLVEAVGIFKIATSDLTSTMSSYVVKTTTLNKLGSVPSVDLVK